MARLKPLLMFLPVAIFFFLVVIFLQAGRPSRWHERCLQLYAAHQWNELAALGANLRVLGKADPATLLFAAIAEKHMQSADLSGSVLRRFGSLNYEVEWQAPMIVR